MRARALFAQLEDEAFPILVAAIDETIWGHDDEDPWIKIRADWPAEYEWRETWIHFNDDIGLTLFPPTPELAAVIESAGREQEHA